MKQQPSTRSAYLLLAFLTFLNIINFVDRQLIVILAKPLAEDLGLSLTQVAWLYGYIFLVFYTLMGMVMAAIADRWHRQRLIAGGLFLWSALTAVSGLATSFLHLAAARTLVGIGEATLTPAALSILGDAFPPKRRALASGIYYAGVSLGSGLSLIIAGEMVSRYGWRSCFYALGTLGLLLAPLVLLIKTPPRGAAEAAVTETQSISPAGKSLSTVEIYRTLFQTLRRSPALVLTITAAVLINFSTAASSYSFTWLVKERGMDFRTTGLVMGVIVIVAGLAGSSGVSAISDWFHERYSGGRLWLLFCKAFFFLPFVIGYYTLAIDAPYGLFYVCWFMATINTLSWYGPIFATVQDLAPLRIRATAIAFLMLVINLIGTGLGPLVAGMIGDRHSLWRGLMVCAAIGYLSIVPLFLAARRYKTDLERARESETALLASPSLA